MRLNRAKSFIFRRFPVFAVAAFGVGLLIVLGFDLEEKPALLGGLLAGVLGFCYFMQQQRLAETELFHKLFTEFNRRYDRMNGPLGEILAAGNATPEQTQLIVDYFNLCAEEYVFFSEGYILPHVWQAWCRGMLQYVEHEPFRTIWRKEFASGSYYGLTEDVIRQEAA